MSTLEVLTGKPYLSYSALDSYLTCGERYRLERVVSVAQSPAYWFVGGSAFHLACEWSDTYEKNTPAAELWANAWAECYRKDIPEDTPKAEIRRTGRTKSLPNGEDEEWWMKNGPLMVDAYIAWRDTSGYHLPAPEFVEIPFDIQVGDTKVHGYVDRLFVDQWGQYVIFDLKTGKRVPPSTLQLGIYSLGIEDALQIQRPILGSYYMARQARATDHKSLAHFTKELVGQWMDTARTAIEQELFIPHVTALCGSCSVAPYCVAVGGTAPLAAPASS